MDTQYVASPGEIAKNFLMDVFGSKWRDAWIADVPGDPKTTPDRSAWVGMSADDLVDHLTGDGNAYYCVAIVDGRRHRDNFIEAPVLVLDDVGSRIAPETVSNLFGEPRWLVQTSPGSQQWVYVLSAPISDRTLYARALTALKARGLTDKGSGDVVHFMRLPVGTNGKPEYGSPPPRVTGVKRGDNLLDVGHLLDVLGLNGGPALLASPHPAGSGPLSARRKKDRTAGSVELIRRAVAAIPNDAEFDAYGAFEAMGEAIKGAAGDDPGGLEVWLDFCACSEAHHNDPDVMEAKYWSFGADHAGWASILRRVAERDAGLAETLRREGARFKFEDTTPDDDDRADTLADEAKAKARAEAAEEHQALTEMGSRYALVHGEKSIIDVRGTETSAISRVSREAFTLVNDAVMRIGKGRACVGLGTHCLKTPGVLPIYERIDMVDPPGSEGVGILNIWHSFAVAPTAGAWPRIELLIREGLADGDTAIAEHILNWVAWGFQHPLERGGTTLCLVGRQGTGKSAFGNLLRTIYGTRYSLHASADSDLVGTFNARLENRLLFVGDEAVFGGDPRIKGRLKSLITEPTIRAEGKYRDAKEIPNRLKFLFTSNEEAALPVEPGDRRSTVVRVSDRFKGDHAFWNDFFANLDVELPAFLHDMLARDLRSFEHRKALSTAAKADMAEATASPLVRFLIERIESGDAPGADGLLGLNGQADDWEIGPVRVPVAELFDDFEAWARRKGARHLPARSALGHELQGVIAGITVARPNIGKRQVRTYTLPSRDDCRRSIRRALGADDEGS